MYEKLPPTLRSSVFGGKPWVKLNLDRFLHVPAFAQVGNDNGQQSLQLLRHVTGSVTKVGAETDAGVQTTRYAASIPFSGVAKITHLDPAIVRIYKQQGGPATIPVQVDIDSQGRTRRVADSVAEPPVGSTHITGKVLRRLKSVAGAGASTS